MIKKCLVFGFMLFLALAPGSLAQEEVACERDVIVQADDWLSKLSDKFYGDVLAYPAIYEATNAKSAEDISYAVIEDEDLIEPGWKLCIVGVSAAQEILGFELENAPVVADAPLTFTGPILVGAAHALSGPLAAQGESIKNGISLAVSQINQTEYLGDGRLELLWEDTAGTDTQAVAAFERLVSQEQLVAILGPTLSHSAFAANPIAQNAGVPVIGSSNIEAGVTEIGDYIFRTSMPESAIIAGTVQLAARRLGLARVVIVYDAANTFTVNSLPIFERALAGEAIEVLAAVPFETGSPDFSAQLAQLSSLNTDAVVLIALSNDAAQIISQARQFGLPESTIFIGANSFNTPVFFETGQQAVDGTLSGSAWNVTTNTGSNRQFVAAYQAAYGPAPDTLAAQAYTAAWVLASALRRANSTDRNRVRDALAGLEFVDSPLGLFSFDEARNPVHPIVLQVANSGEFITETQNPGSP